MTLTIKARIVTLVGLLLLALVIVGGANQHAETLMYRSVGSFYQDRVVPLEKIKQVSDHYAVFVIDAVNKTNAGIMTAEEALEGLRRAQQDKQRRWKEYLATEPTAEEAPLVADAERLMSVADRDVARLEQFLAGKHGKIGGQLDAFDGPLYTNVDPLTAKLAELANLELREAEREYAQAGKAYTFASRLSVATSVAAMVLAVILGVLLLRAVVPPIRRIAGLMHAMAQGDTGIAVEAERRDELGDLVTAFRALHEKARADVQAATRAAEEGARVRQALDCANLNVRIADRDGTIVYVNRAMQRTLQEIEPELRRRAPGFRAADVVGQSVAVFYDRPDEALARLRGLNHTAVARMVIGGRTYDVTTTPVVDDRGHTVGTVGEWVDVTQQLAAQRELEDAVAEAAQGQLDTRIALAGKDGFLLTLAQGFNRLLDEVSGSLGQLSALLQRLATGDLSRGIEQQYSGVFGRLAQDANATLAQLRDLIQRLQEASHAIDTAAREIAQGNADLSGRTEQQAASLQETASSMEELTSTVRQNAENARQANQLAIGASDVATRGGEVVGQVVRTMGEINDSSRKIVEIISVIDGIAFQTNILALNAAVEAARAGEQGRGFAVVATEVRNLAQRSAAAAKEIKGLISDSVSRVDGGSKLVEQAGRTMEEIVTAVKRVTDIMSEISAASLEQSSGIEQVNQAVTQMDEVTQQNAALVEQAAAAAESLREQAGTLAQSVAVFKVSEHAPAAGLVERRGPNRATNVERIGPAKASAPKKALPKPARKVANATDDEWEEF
jgi:methyl-accepting chemotaxis protein